MDIEMPALHEPSQRPGDEAAMDLVLAAEDRARADVERASSEAQAIVEAAHARSRAIAAAAARRIGAIRASMERRLADRLARIAALEKEAPGLDVLDRAAYEQLELAVRRQASELTGGAP